MSMGRKSRRRFVKIRRVVSCLVVSMIAPFIILLGVVVAQRLLLREIRKPCNDFDDEKKGAAFERAMRRHYSGKPISPPVPDTPTIDVDIGKPGEDKTVIYDYESKDPIDLNLKAEEMTEEQKEKLVVRRNFILQDQYGHYMDLAIFDLHCCAQTIMSIVEEVGSSDFVSVQRGYKVVVTRHKKEKAVNGSK
jgi:hypothetical protein